MMTRSRYLLTLLLADALFFKPRCLAHEREGFFWREDFVVGQPHDSSHGGPHEHEKGDDLKPEALGLA